MMPSKVEQAIGRASERSPQSAMVMEKVWLIRKIGELVSNETRELNRQRRRIKRNVNRKYKQFNRSIENL